MTYTATLSSTLAKLSTLKEKSKYTRSLMDLYCTEEETVHNALSGLFKTKVLFQKKEPLFLSYSIAKKLEEKKSSICLKSYSLQLSHILQVHFPSSLKYGTGITRI